MNISNFITEYCPTSIRTPAIIFARGRECAVIGNSTTGLFVFYSFLFNFLISQFSVWFRHQTSWLPVSLYQIVRSYSFLLSLINSKAEITLLQIIQGAIFLGDQFTLAHAHWFRCGNVACFVFVIFSQFLAFERSRNGLSGSAESAESYGATNCILYVKFF